MNASIICTWDHPDCVNRCSKDHEKLMGDPEGTIRCNALHNCEFPNREDCPFYKSTFKGVTPYTIASSK